MIKPLQKNKELFCEQYWKRVMKKTKPKAYYQTRISTNFDISIVNNFLMDTTPEARKTLESKIEMPLSKFLAVTDKEFKLLPPTKEDLVLWRGVSKPSKESKYKHAQFESSYNCKPGDTISIPIYAYASDEKKVALSFAKYEGKQKSILYEFYLPKGSRINKGLFYNFPRCSNFECIATQDITTDKMTCRKISLKYIQPKEIKQNSFYKIKNFAKKIFKYFST